MGAYSKIVLSETDNSSILDSVSNSTVEREMEKFNTSYSSEKVQDIFNAYDNITVTEDMLKENTLIKTNAVSISSSNASFKQKLLLTSATIICAIMLFLAIFNIFVINGVGKDINILKDNIASEEKTYYDLYKDWNTATNNSGIEADLSGAGYTLTSQDSVISVSVNELREVETLSGSTNWFDGVCNFVNSVFGR